MEADACFSHAITGLEKELATGPELQLERQRSNVSPLPSSGILVDADALRFRGLVKVIGGLWDPLQRVERIQADRHRSA